MSARAILRSLAVALVAPALAGATPAAALPLPAGAWLSAGVLAGATGFGERLADYQWDTAPRSAWGAQALAGAGRFGGGVRLWRASSTQAIGSAAASDAAVGVTSVELLGRARVASFLASELSLTGSAGWVRLAYDPDQVAYDTGGGAPVVVDLAPVHGWIAGGGVALRRPLAGAWCAGIEVEGRVFPLEAAHRDGGAIVTRRESFGDWTARLELARLWGDH